MHIKCYLTCCRNASVSCINDALSVKTERYFSNPSNKAVQTRSFFTSITEDIFGQKLSSSLQSRHKSVDLAKSQSNFWPKVFEKWMNQNIDKGSYTASLPVPVANFMLCFLDSLGIKSENRLSMRKIAVNNNFLTSKFVFTSNKTSHFWGWQLSCANCLNAFTTSFGWISCIISVKQSSVKIWVLTFNYCVLKSKMPVIITRPWLLIYYSFLFLRNDVQNLSSF